MKLNKVVLSTLICSCTTVFAGCGSDSSSEKTLECMSPLSLCGELCCEHCCDGVCIDLQNDRDHCGACETTCNDDETCKNGSCDKTSTNPESEQCTGELTLIDGSCVNTNSDSEHCGKDNIACGTNMYCHSGVCECQQNYYDCDEDASNGCESSEACPKCLPPRTQCTDVCTNLQTDNQHCGDCETSCKENEHCDNGQCKTIEQKTPCESPNTLCYGTCTDLKNDSQNCGSCLNSCNPGYACIDGACEIVCESPLEKCDGACFDYSQSIQHCGSCHQACAANQMCDAGKCKCDADHYDCDGLTTNGCESTEACGCTPGTTRKCWRGSEDNIKSKDPLELYGICEPGEQKCDASGLFWGACEGGKYPSDITCKEDGHYIGGDQNCNGIDDTEEPCRSECDLKNGELSYIGCEYWPVFLQNSRGYSSSGYCYSLSLVISNPSSTNTAEVYIYDKPSYENASFEPYAMFEVKPNEVVHRMLVGDPEGRKNADNTCNNTMKPGTLITDYQMANNQVVSGTFTNKIIRSTAFRMRSSEPVVVYQFNTYGNANANSSDASLMLPQSTLGNQYMTMGYTSAYSSAANNTGAIESNDEISVVATEPGETKITIKVKADTRAGIDERTNTPIESIKAGEEKVFTLRQFDALSLQQLEIGESTGTEITANKKIEVFGGASCAYIPETQRDGCDHIEEQILPLQAWGKQYAAVRTKPQNDVTGAREPNFYYILAQTDDTQVTLTGPETNEDGKSEPAHGTITLNAGEFKKFESKSSFDVIADKPIYVGQFLVSMGYSNKKSDPSFISLVPVEQYRKDYAFSIPGGFKSFVTIISPKDNVIKYTGAGKTANIETPTELKDLPAGIFEGYKDFGNQGYVYTYLTLQQGVHYLEGTKEFGVVGYGFDSSYTSYGYPIGMELKKINNTN